MTRKILVVDDDKSLSQAMCLTLERELDCKVDEAESAANAIELLKLNHYDVVISDMSMKEDTGLDLFAYLQCEKKDIPIIFFTASEIDISPLMTSGDVSLVRKPGFDQVLELIRSNYYSSPRKE